MRLAAMRTLAAAAYQIVNGISVSHSITVQRRRKEFVVRGSL
jgi:hypothetical protein